MIPHHLCTETDWAMFPQPSSSSAGTIEALKSDPNRGMFCFDWDTVDMIIHGNENNDEHARIEFLMVPCNYIHQLWGYEGDAVAPECETDLEKQIEYLGNLNVFIYYSEDVFQRD